MNIYTSKMGQEKGPYAEENITNTVEKKTTQTIKFILLFKRLKKKRERDMHMFRKFKYPT